MNDELDRLEAEAAALDAAAAPPDPEAEAQAQAEAQHAADPGAEIRGILEALRGIAKARGFRRAADTLTDEAVEAIAGALVPVLSKYGITPSAFFGKWREEVFAVLIVGPIMFELVTAFRMDLDAKAAAAAKEVRDAAKEPAPADASGQ